MKLAIVLTHPIQYYAPWFKYMTDFLDLHVFYMHQESVSERSKGDFGIAHEWDVDLLTGYDYTFLKNVAKEPSVNNFRGCDTPEIYKVIQDGKFDAVLVLGWYVKAFWQTIFACKKYGVPVLVRGDSQLQKDEPFVKKMIKSIIYPWMLKIFDGFLYVGENNKQYLQYFGVSDHKLFFCPHFIDQEFFYHQSQGNDKSLLREKLNIIKDSVVLLFVGKFIEKKRPLDILKAMKLLEEESISIEFIFVGSGKLELSLQQYCEDNKELKVHFVGFKNQTELPAYYALADVLVLPSESGETWGLVVNEAFATLTPAIVSDQVGCMPDMVEKGITGEVFECGNIVDLSEKIKSYTSNLDVDVVQSKIQNKNKIYSIQNATKNLIKAIGEVKNEK